MEPRDDARVTEEGRPVPVKVNYTLVNGDFYVHKAGCADLSKTAPRGRYGNRSGRGDYVAAASYYSQSDAIRDLWSDIIGDNAEEVESDAYLRDHYSMATIFMPCVSLPETSPVCSECDRIVSTVYGHDAGCSMPTREDPPVKLPGKPPVKDLHQNRSVRSGRRVRSDRNVPTLREPKMASRTRSAKTATTAKTECPGTGQRWAVLDGTAACPECELSPGAIGADAPVKRGRGFTGTVPAHYISNVTQKDLAESAKRASAPVDPVPPRAKPVTVERYTIVPGKGGKFFIHDAVSADIVGLADGYGSKERAERKMAELNAAAPSQPALVSPKSRTATNGTTPARSGRKTSPAAPLATSRSTAAKPLSKAAQARADAEEAATRATRARQQKPAPAPAPAETNGNGKAAKQAAKRTLAVLALEAVAEMFNSLPDDSPVFDGMDEDEAAMCLSNWAHHWPVGETWPTDILPVPDRSNWR